MSTLAQHICEVIGRIKIIACKFLFAGYMVGQYLYADRTGRLGVEGRYSQPPPLHPLTPHQTTF